MEIMYEAIEHETALIVVRGDGNEDFEVYSLIGAKGGKLTAKKAVTRPAQLRKTFNRLGNARNYVKRQDDAVKQKKLAAARAGGGARARRHQTKVAKTKAA